VDVGLGTLSAISENTRPIFYNGGFTCSVSVLLLMFCLYVVVVSLLIIVRDASNRVL